MTMLEGFLSSTADGRTRVLSADGEFVDLLSEHVVERRVVGAHASGLFLWRVEHTDDDALSGRFADLDLDILFVAEGHESPTCANAEATNAANCDRTTRPVCDETRHGPCT